MGDGAGGGVGLGVSVHIRECISLHIFRHCVALLHTKVLDCLCVYVLSSALKKGNSAEDFRVYRTTFNVVVVLVCLFVCLFVCFCFVF